MSGKLTIVLLLTVAALMGVPGALAATPVDYSATIQPIFNANCTTGCHMPGGEAEFYDLTNYAGATSGGFVIPGNATNSVLFQQVNTGSMPPSGPKLSATDIQSIADWINQGALSTPPTATSAATFNISGFKINNATGSGVQSWNITLTNITMKTSTLTGADGSYKFMNLVNGTYNITEEMKTGWTNVSPTLQQVIINSTDIMNINFTNQPPSVAGTFNISGFKINGTDNNGMGIENWNIMLLNPATGAELANTTTDSTGFYKFSNLTNGTYSVIEGMKTGWMNISAMSQIINISGADAMNVNFTNTLVVPPQETFSISGFKINGTNGNGMGLENWNIILYNDTGAQIANTMTDSMGFYNFTNLTNGTYNVTEEMMAGWMNASNSPISQNATINGSDVTNVNFTNILVPQPTGSISGTKYNDLNGNGIWDQGEQGLANWTIVLTMPGGSTEDTTTNSDGFYIFNNLSAGDYNVSEVLQPGWVQTYPSSPIHSIILSAGENVTDVDFGNMQIVAPTFNISGFKINGTDNNGMGIENWNIMLLNPDTGAEIANTTTDGMGFYKFSNLTNGTYKVTEEMRMGWMNISATSQIINISGADVMNVNFTNALVVPPQATFSISGFKIDASSGSGIPGWNITLTNSTMQTTTMTTDMNGFYEFTGLVNGTYNVSEEMRPGFTPVGATFKVITIENMDVMNVNFTNQITVTPPQGKFNISGFKVNDTNGNNVWEPGEMGIENWNIRLLNATTGTQIASTSTNASGSYEFMNLAPGVYNVTEEMKPGFTPSGATFKVVTIENMDVTDVDFLNHVTVAPTPIPKKVTICHIPPGNPKNKHTITVDESAVQAHLNHGDTLGPCVTPTPTTGSISGFKINDLNGNGKQDAGENGLSGWNIRLSGIVPETAGINMETTTDENGFYSFENIPAGMYLVVETLKGGYVPVGSPVLTVNLANGMNSMNNNFMNRPIQSLVGIEENKDIENHKDKEDRKDAKDDRDTESHKDTGSHKDIEDDKDTE
jgi:serine-aspartate repeat-containing protein C/D/E